jgi:hypothetical protein
MKRVAITAAAIAALAFSPAALAAGGLSGKYKTKIISDHALGGSLNGTWTLDFKPNGSYTVTDDGTIVIRGKFTSTASKITLSHEKGTAACPATGRYSYKLTAQTLKFSRISDPTCPGRSGVLANTFKTVG